MGGYFASTNLIIGSEIIPNAGGTDGFIAKNNWSFKASITEQKNISCYGSSDAVWPF